MVKGTILVFWNDKSQDKIFSNTFEPRYEAEARNLMKTKNASSGDCYAIKAIETNGLVAPQTEWQKFE